MGNNESRSHSGYRIIRLFKNGPAALSNLEIFFDYIVEVGGIDVTSTSMQGGYGEFRNRIGEFVDKPLKLIVYNARTRMFKVVYVVPTKRDTGGFLGAAVAFDRFESAQEQGIRIISVFPNSAGEAAGLTPLKDYLIASSEGIFTSLNDLTAFINKHNNERISIYAYHSKTESIREVKIDITSGSGGISGLGCDVATGYINRWPLSGFANVGAVDLESRIPIITEASPTVEPPMLIETSQEDLTDATIPIDCQGDNKLHPATHFVDSGSISTAELFVDTCNQDNREITGKSSAAKEDTAETKGQEIVSNHCASVKGESPQWCIESPPQNSFSHELNATTDDLIKKVVNVVVNESINEAIQIVINEVAEEAGKEIQADIAPDATINGAMTAIAASTAGKLQNMNIEENLELQQDGPQSEILENMNTSLLSQLNPAPFGERSKQDSEGEEVLINGCQQSHSSLFIPAYRSISPPTPGTVFRVQSHTADEA